MANRSAGMQNYLDQLGAKFVSWGPQIGLALLAAAIGVAVALVLHRLLYGVLKRIAKASESEADDIVVKSLAQPTRYSMIALGLALAARDTPALQAVWQEVAGFLMPALIGWIALAILHSFVTAMELRSDISVPDNLEARRRRTRLAIFARLGSFLIVFVTIGLMLLSIPGVRSVGVTLMASAGLAGLAVGAAAQPALKSLIAGVQMALTEPISIDDVVIINGEWGRIEDIRTTYVVVRIWDQRRLIVPTTKFLDEVVENWTRESAELLGTVFLYLDPLAEIGPIRAEFERQIKAHKLWDGRAQSMLVTDTKPEAIVVRLLMSAGNASDAFAMRCDIREGILAWIRENQPQAIVRHRVEPAGAVTLAGNAA
jgi:small-conductance mechanosensitive channel